MSDVGDGVGNIGDKDDDVDERCVGGGGRGGEVTAVAM